ncbi:hypothetical protein AKJ41_00895 [candidate division MSBL1 archaeon SCGC-AAA259O05]|uniref:OB domain-containing protein n=1 Tax=candidate division MSBL1 archaeon SCGC-AAA259O05 TaxID=1698271 RepID=A0A133V563_9EURY|nr:hypothetical protein AKJ41_00895 [candidate division MSBL1 archaeon SCGC-AAA259O05]
MSWRGRIVRNPPAEDVESLPELEKKLLKIEEIEPDMPILDVAAKVKRTFPPNEFERDDGSTGKVKNVILADGTGSIRASFWDDQVEIGEKLSEGDTVLIENARSVAGLQERPEIRIGGRTNLEVNPDRIEVGEMKPKRLKISEVGEGLDSLEVVGRITDRSEISTFTREDESEGKVGSLTIGDETGTIRVAIWGDRTEVMDRLERGDVIKITESYTVPGNYGGAEIHVGERGKIETNPECEEELPPVSEIPCEHFQQTKARRIE